MKREPLDSLLSDERLIEYFNSLKWDWQATEKGGEYAHLSQIHQKSRLLIQLLFGIFRNRQHVNLDGYRYRLSGSYLIREGPRVRKPTESKLAYTVKKVSRMVIKI